VLKTAGYQARFIEEMAKHCAKLVFLGHTALPSEESQMDVEVGAGNVSWVGLGPHDSVPRRLQRIPQITKALRHAADELDAILLRIPTPLTPLVLRATRSIAVVPLLVGRIDGADAVPDSRWFRRLAIRAFWRINRIYQDRAMRGTLSFANSERLIADAGGSGTIRLLRTVSLRQSEVWFREDTCNSRPVRLLYVGRIAEEKGLIHIVEALGQIVKAGEDDVLDLVGAYQDEDPFIHSLRERLRIHDLTGRVAFQGHAAMGRALFEHYKRADIFVIGSTSDFEGFPRVLWEAMAHGLPIVATTVGGIPDVANGIAQLVPPRSASGIAAAVGRILGEPVLRQAMISAGFRAVRGVTMEPQVREMMEQIHVLVAERTSAMKA